MSMRDNRPVTDLNAVTSFPGLGFGLAGARTFREGCVKLRAVGAITSPW
jgi:hypothetical protein